MCKGKQLSFVDYYFCKKTFNFALDFNVFYMRNTIIATIFLLFSSALSVSAQVEEVDSAYLSQIENLIAQAEINQALDKVNEKMLRDEMKFEYGNLIPLVTGFVSLYTRHDFVNNHPSVFEKTNYNVADYGVALSPFAAAWIMKLAGVKSRSTTRRMVTSNALAVGLAVGLTQGTKHLVKEPRPDLSDNHSFPSGHTTLAYVGATILSREFGYHSPWITVGAYSAATAASMLRIHHNSHWLNDVYMGAGIGVVSANFGYWLADRIFGEEGINKPRMTRKDMERVLKMSGTPSSVGLVAASDLGNTKIESDKLLFADDENLPVSDMHLHLSSFTLAGVEASLYLNPYLSVEGLVQSSVGQAKVYSPSNTMFTGNTINMYRGSLGVKGSFSVPGSGSRIGVRALTGVRNTGQSDFYLVDGPQFITDESRKITLPKQTKFEIGCGLNFDIIEGKSHVVGLNFDYYHAFTKVMPNRYLISSAWKVLF